MRWTLLKSVYRYERGRWCDTGTANWNAMKRRTFLAQCAIVLGSLRLSLSSHRILSGRTETLLVYRSKICSCCGEWISYMRKAGYAIEEIEPTTGDALHNQLHIPRQLASCHTSIGGGFVFEGHVPEPMIRRVLRERPAIAGLAVPGMPHGAPGMKSHDGDTARASGDMKVFAFRKDGRVWLYEG